MNNRLNKYKYPGAKRLMLEAQELKDNTEDYCAQPLDDNLFEWHFTVRGPPDTAFDGGYYHGRLSFPTEYPMKPPSIILLTPNGRFETNKKICLSISGYHPETWQPSWSVRTALLALIAFMPTKANRAIGSLDFSDAERKKLAQKSRTWRCESCGLIKDLLIQPESVNTESNREQMNDSQRPGTSRVLEESSPSSTNVKCNSSNGSSTNNNNSSNNSDSEKSDITNDTEGSESNKTSSSDEDSSQKTVGPLEDVPQPTDSPASIHGSSNNRPFDVIPQPIDRQQQPSGPDQSFVEPRRASYPPLVLKSIFILLSLLILRRVVMVIQA